MRLLHIFFEMHVIRTYSAEAVYCINVIKYKDSVNSIMLQDLYIAINLYLLDSFGHTLFISLYSN